MIEAVGRAIEAGRFDEADPEELATQLWIMMHGGVTLHMANCLTFDEALHMLETMALNLYVAFGDDREAAKASIERGRERIVEHLAAESERLGLEISIPG
jgi:hypothetical protein